MQILNEGVPQIAISAALITIVIQTALVLLWVGRAGARLDMMEARLESHEGVIERLARLEEQAIAQRAALERIEKAIGGGQR